MTMTADAKRALSKTIRELREKVLLPDLRDATERAYQLSIDAKKATLSEAARTKRARIDAWLDEQTRSLATKERPASRQRLFDELIKDAAATLLQRIVYVRLLEANKLRPRVITGGWNSPEYKAFREIASDLVLPDKSGGKVRDDSEGFSTLLQLIFDELALDIPGLFGPVRMTSLVPVPSSTLRSIISAFDDPELESVWTDDTTLGWIYQYWNDPEREALDAKLAAQKKLENHEIASKTQMFTERYMVEWLLHNSLGQLWLAMCNKHGWIADVQRDDGNGSVLDRLDGRRAEWRKMREADEVALDALMPIASGLEDRWKYWVPQPMPDDAPAVAPDSVRAIKLLDPACGSGHFLVIAFDLLFHLYKEEARHRSEVDQPQWSDQAVVDSILENNLHGIDIDPRAIQIAAAALTLKARLVCKNSEPRTLNLVAPALSLAELPSDDPGLRGLYKAVEDETGVPPKLTERIITALAGANHLGSLLKVDAEIDAAITAWDEKLSAAIPTRDDQGSLFSGYGPARRKRITAQEAKATLSSRLERFLAQHGRGADLGLRLRGEQIAAGVRFVQLLRENQYDLVVGNPPYQGTTKLVDKAYIEKHFSRGKADLYAAFIERCLQLVRDGGVSALLTMRNWMFIKQFGVLRKWLLETYDLRLLGDVDRGAFDEVPNEILAAAMTVVRRCPPSNKSSIALQPTPLDDRSYDRERTRRKRAALLAQYGTYTFDTRSLRHIEGTPIVYWWPDDLRHSYIAAPKLGNLSPVKTGLCTSDNERFLRKHWELPPEAVGWSPYVSGGKGLAWMDPCDMRVLWKSNGLQMKVYNESLYGSYSRTIQNEIYYMRTGVTYTPIGNRFYARAFYRPAIMGKMGSSVFPQKDEDIPRTLCAMNSALARMVLGSINPGLHFEVGDVNRLPFVEVPVANTVFEVLRSSFANHESARETSADFRAPSRSTWSATQEWAQGAVDGVSAQPPDSQLAACEAPTDHLSFSIGIALGRFDASGAGILREATNEALPHGILYLSNDADVHDSLSSKATKPIVDAWARYGGDIDRTRTLKEFLRERFFVDVHRRMYENRPIYFPLSSTKRTYVAYVSIHRWTSSTLTALLAEYLYPERKRLLGQKTDLSVARSNTDKRSARAAEKQFDSVVEWLDELDDFIAKVEEIAHKGPPPVDAKTTPREIDAKFEMDLDDGVMINSAALWPLLEPQWKDPKKWWKELANANGKKDYDWAHMAARYFPERVDGKCKLEPSLAVAHGCFWKYHPRKAYQWELRLQDEIRPDFTIDELDSEATRKGFEAEHRDEVDEFVAKEYQRRERKRGRSVGNEPSDTDVQPALDLYDDGDGDSGGEELSA